MSKLHILFPFKNQPTGGGNQFLQALRAGLRECGAYAESLDEADCLIFNSHHFGAEWELYSKLYGIKRRRGKSLKVIHRVDGPVAVVRGSARDLIVDQSIGMFNAALADGTVFQSHWSRDVCHSFGIGHGKPETVIGNAPDNRLFFPSPSEPEPIKCARVRIIATSWSSNWRKGFDIYRFLDLHLDFNRYEMLFVGNSPVSFRNITKVDPLPSAELGHLLRSCHLYLTASMDDPCSNAVVEAMHCGLTVVARNSGGHPELVGTGGLLFEGRQDILTIIDRAAGMLRTGRLAAVITDMSSVVGAYIQFARNLMGIEDARLTAVPSLAFFVGLSATALRARIGARLTTSLTRTLPVREHNFYPSVRAFRQATWEPSTNCAWSELEARKWLDGMLHRLPVFLDSMRHPSNKALYRYSLTGDLDVQPGLASSVFVAKIRYMADLLDDDERTALTAHILSFESEGGAIADPWVATHSIPRRLYAVLRSRRVECFSSIPAIRAETRQAFSALFLLGSRPRRPFNEIPKTDQDIVTYIRMLDWSHPWGAASHLSHLVFFLHHHAIWFGSRGTVTAREILTSAEATYRRLDGAWYSPGCQLSDTEKVNGAMKMVTAFNVVEMDGVTNPEGLIDLCLSAVNAGHACNHFNVVCVLHHCMQLTSHRSREVRTYLLDRLRAYHGHYWPWQGGFSFFPGSANHAYYNARVTTGMAEPDVHGTILMIWGIVLITEALGWESEFRLRRPIT